MYNVVQRYDGLWQVICPTCGNLGGNYKSKEKAEEIAKLSEELHERKNHK